MSENLASRSLASGGAIAPLIISSKHTNGTGLCNPSIFVDDGKILLNVRHVQYMIYHSEKEQKFPSWHGPLIYLHPENDVTLRTENYLCELETDLTIKSFQKVNMLGLHQPAWTFIGLEDVRLVKWNEKLYMTGVRRDTNSIGQGRMELSEIVDGREVSRTRIEPPNPESYCEKNWMPVLDKPFHYVKWTSPTEVVVAEEGKAKTAYMNPCKIPFYRDIRGGSQLIPFDGGYLAVTHEVDFWYTEGGHKDAHYYHRFIMWDREFNVIAASKEFKFMDARIEFCCGLAQLGDDLLITFGFQDNSAFLLRTPAHIVKTMLNDEGIA
jgi:hypothetical protein